MNIKNKSMVVGSIPADEVRDFLLRSPSDEAQWLALARSAIDSGASEKDFVDHVHKTNRDAARDAYRAAVK